MINTSQDSSAVVQKIINNALDAQFLEGQLPIPINLVSLTTQKVQTSYNDLSIASPNLRILKTKDSIADYRTHSMHCFNSLEILQIQYCSVRRMPSFSNINVSLIYKKFQQKQLFELAQNMHNFRLVKLQINYFYYLNQQSIQKLSNLKHLKSLSLGHMAIRQNILQLIFENLELQQLKFACVVVNLIPSSRSLRKYSLSKLTMINTKMNSEELYNLLSIQGLKSIHLCNHIINLENRQIQPKQLNEIIQIAHLFTQISLEECKLKDSSLLNLLFAAKNIYSLSLSQQSNNSGNNFSLTQLSIQALTLNNPNIQILNLQGLYLLTFKTIIIISNRLLHLKQLNISCTKLVNSQILYLGKIKNLEILKINGNSITSVSVKLLLSNLKRLKKFHFSIPTKLDDKDIKNIPLFNKSWIKYSHGIKYLNQ